MISNKNISFLISDFAKEKVFWTRKMNLKLVKFIETKPNIWNPKHPKYTSVAIRDRTYAEFAAKYGNEFTWQAVKDRWTNIRSTFANYLRKLKASRSKGDGEVYKVNWHLWEACSFLLKVNRKNMKSKNLSINCDNVENGVDEQKQQDTSEIEDTFEQTPTDTNCENIVQNLVTVFQNLQNDTIDVQNSKYGEIGKVVSKKLSEMSPFDAARMTYKVTEILLLYDENNPVNPNNLKLQFA